MSVSNEKRILNVEVLSFETQRELVEYLSGEYVDYLTSDCKDPWAVVNKECIRFLNTLATYHLTRQDYAIHVNDRSFAPKCEVLQKISIPRNAIIKICGINYHVTTGNLINLWHQFVESVAAEYQSFYENNDIPINEVIEFLKNAVKYRFEDECDIVEFVIDT